MNALNFKTCPYCSSMYLQYHWCNVTTEVIEAAPIEPRPALPAECWNGDAVDAEVAMAAVRVLCGRSS